MIRIRKLKDVSDFIAELPEYDAAACNNYVDLLEEFGWKLKDPYTEHTNGIYILRPSGKGGEFRLFYGFVKGEAFIVHAVHKKGRKLEPKDIHLAKERIQMVKCGKIILC